MSHSPAAARGEDDQWPNWLPPDTGPYLLLRGQQFSVQMPRSILSGRCTRRSFGTAHSSAAAHPSSRSWRRHWLQTYEWLKCSFAGARGGGTTFANGGGTLPSAFSGSSVTTQRAAVAASHGRACAQGHLNLIPTLLSQPMVEQHFIPRGHIITL